jgi:2-polyprenyl-3-methyl-5-hydroxy-6-metoxy-1,4-benzoquinol methylase
MNLDGISPDRLRANLTARDNYMGEGLGIGAGGEAIAVLESRTTLRLAPGSRVGEVGCASLQLAEALLPRQVSFQGVDIRVDHQRAQEVHRTAAEPSGMSAYSNFWVQEADVSHEIVQWVENSLDAVFCTETIEHLSNPYFMCAQVKRALRHGGAFVLAFPQPLRNLGFSSGLHAHIMPGFLLKDSFELFMRQLYFKKIHYHENGSSDWYVFANYKGPGVVDVFSMTTGNYDDATLFDCLDAYEPPFRAAMGVA